MELGGTGLWGQPCHTPLDSPVGGGSLEGLGGRLLHPRTPQLRWLVRPPWDLQFVLLCLTSWPCTWLPHVCFPSHGLMFIADDPFEVFPNYHERQHPAVQTPQSSVFYELATCTVPPFSLDRPAHPAPQPSPFPPVPSAASHPLQADGSVI